jgi:hypothetical protein
MDNSTSAVSCAELRKRRKAEYDREYRKRVKTNTDKSGAREEELARHGRHVHRSRLPAQHKHRTHTLRLVFQLSSTLAESINGSVVKFTKKKNKRFRR